MRAPRRALVASLILGVTTAAAMPARAAAQARETSLAVVGGIYTFNEFQGDTDPILGARGTMFLTPTVGLEADLDWIPAGNGLTVLGYQGAVVFRVPTAGSTVPFFNAGLGAITFTGNGVSDTRFAGLLGGGITTPISGGTTAFRLEVRDRMYEVASDFINDFHLTAGLEFPF